jgi:hypothetical protein
MLCTVMFHTVEAPGRCSTAGVWTADLLLPFLPAGLIIAHDNVDLVLHAVEAAG